MPKRKQDQEVAPPTAGLDLHEALTCQLCMEPYFICMTLACTHCICRHCFVRSQPSGASRIPDCPFCNDENTRGPTARKPLLNRPVNTLVEEAFAKESVEVQRRRQAQEKYWNRMWENSPYSDFVWGSAFSETLNESGTPIPLGILPKRADKAAAKAAERVADAACCASSSSSSAAAATAAPKPAPELVVAPAAAAAPPARRLMIMSAVGSSRALARVANANSRSFVTNAAIVAGIDCPQCVEEEVRSASVRDFPTSVVALLRHNRRREDFFRTHGIPSIHANHALYDRCVRTLPPSQEPLVELFGVAKKE